MTVRREPWHGLAQSVPQTIAQGTHSLRPLDEATSRQRARHPEADDRRDVLGPRSETALVPSAEDKGMQLDPDLGGKDLTLITVGRRRVEISYNSKVLHTQTENKNKWNKIN